MDATKASARSTKATQVLHRLDALGAIKLDVLLAKASEIQGAAALDDDDDHRICYRAYIHIGPREDLDIVSVAAQLHELGFDLKRTAGPQGKG